MSEIILERDRRERLALALHLDALLRFDGLVQAVGEAASRHDAARELVDDDDLAVLDDVVAVALHEGLRAQRRHEAVGILDILRRVEVLHADELLDFRHSTVGRRDA